MSVAEDRPSDPPVIRPSLPLAERPGLALAVGGALALGLTLPSALNVVRTGIFLNPDDAMRAVEVRDFMAGQPWFDLVPHRLSPDHPFVMHWSRLVDVPLAVLVRVFGTVLPPAGAELAMRLVAPVLLLVLAMALIGGIARVLAGPGAVLPAVLLFAGSTEAVAQFVPGHIHHHGVQATLLLGCVRCLVAALRAPWRWGAAAGTGLLAAVSLGVGLQNLPFVLGLAAVAGAAWIAWGSGPLLAGFGAAFALGGAVAFLVDVPPSAWGEGACDAFSSAHLLLAAATGVSALALAAATPRLPTPASRSIAAGVAAGAVLALIAAYDPACLHDPMAAVDPVLRSRWLANVGEALPLPRLVRADPAAGIALGATLLSGLLATAAALRRATPAHRPMWSAVSLLAMIGVVGTFYQVRVAPSACALLVPGVAWVVMAVYRAASADPRRPALLLCVVVALCGNGAAWTAMAGPVMRWIAPATPRAAGPASASADPAACFAPGIYAPLAALPPGLVLSTIDPGSTILAVTPHSVLAAPYHRNSDGNRVALLAFAADPDRARPLIRAARATYLALCRASPEAADTARTNPESLAAALLAGRPPAWLVPLGSAQAPVLLYRVGP